MVMTLCLLVQLAAQAPAPTSAELYLQANKHIDDLEYDQAAALLQEIIVAPDADKTLRMNARMALGKVEVIRGRLSEARLHYLWALRQNPSIKLGPDEPPKVRGFFQTVKDEVKAQAPPPDDNEAEDEGGVTPFVIVGVVGAGVVVLAAAAATAGIAGVLVWQAQPSLGVYDLSGE